MLRVCPGPVCTRELILALEGAYSICCRLNGIREHCTVCTKREANNCVLHSRAQWGHSTQKHLVICFSYAMPIVQWLYSDTTECTYSITLFYTLLGLGVKYFFCLYRNELCCTVVPIKILLHFFEQSRIENFMCSRSFEFG